MFLERGSLVYLYFIAILSLFEANTAARSTSFLPSGAAAVWGSTSTGPSLAPTSQPPTSKRSRKSKRRRNVSNLTQKSRIHIGDRDNHKPKKRKRKRRTSSHIAREDLSRSMNYREGVDRAGRSKVRANRRYENISSTVNGKKTKRRRSPLVSVEKQSTKIKVRKTEKRKRRNTTARTAITVAPPEKRKGDSKVPLRKENRVKRRKSVILSKQPSPESTPIKGENTKKRKLKRRKKRRLVSPKEPEVSEIHSPNIEYGATAEESERSSLPFQKILSHDEIDVNTVATACEISLEMDENSAPKIHPDYIEESAGEQIPVGMDQEHVPCTANENEPNIFNPATTDDLFTSDPPDDTSTNVLKVKEDTNTVCEGEDSPAEEISAVEDPGLDKMMVSFANMENKVMNIEEKEQTDGDKVDEASIVEKVSLQPEESPIAMKMQPQIQSQSPLEVERSDEVAVEDGEVKRPPEIDEGAVEDEGAGSGNISDSTTKEEDGVVDFIEDILQEDVKSWVDESSSDTGMKPTSILKDTRGGHQVSNASTCDEMKDDDTNQSKVKDSEESVGKEVETETLAEDTTSEVLSLDRSLLESSLDRSLLESFEDCETDIAVSVVTWNLAETSPAEEDAAFIRNFRKSGIKKGSGSDLVLISGQECENIKPRRSEGSRSREYRRLMIKMLGKQYVPIALHLLGGIQFGLFAKRSFLKEIEEISIADVTCGIGNVFHNKGAIAAFLKVKARNQTSKIKKSKSLRMVFITAHMAAHVKNVDARNSDFWRISSELEVQAPDGFLQEHYVSTESSENESLLFNSADRVFFCGDLNYRVDLPREFTEFDILEERQNDASENLYAELMYHDQLKAVMCENHAFAGFAEGKIEFAPTFKFDKDTGFYDTSHKQRIPAWTDRILFKPFGTRVLEYTSVPDAQHSDHRPVHGTFRVSMEGRDLPPRKSLTRKRRERRQHTEIE